VTLLHLSPISTRRVLQQQHILQGNKSEMNKRYKWQNLPDDQLMRLNLAELGLKITEDSLVAKCRDRLYSELAARELKFKPHLWISDDWFSPDGVPGFAVPFFLLHPRLIELTRSQLVEVEGGTEDWCMRIMRHETGHAIDNAFGLRKLKQRQKLFGLTSTPYPESYSPKPYSRKYVVNLESWYAQAHPDEDWSETFAVWLNPKAKWRIRYPRGLVREKLDYVNEVMGGLRNKRAPNRNDKTPDEINKSAKTLAEYYGALKESYSFGAPHFFDRELMRVFSKNEEHKFNPRADRFLRQERVELRARISKWTGHYHYAVNDIINELIKRSAELNLHLRVGERKTRMDLVAMLSARTAAYLASGEYKIYL
jgi:hypothetical protein